MDLIVCPVIVSPETVNNSSYFLVNHEELQVEYLCLNKRQSLCIAHKKNSTEIEGKAKQILGQQKLPQNAPLSISYANIQLVGVGQDL